MGNSTFLKLTAVCLISSTVPSAMALRSADQAAQDVGLIRRADACPNLSGAFQCAGNFPPGFCCPETSECVPFNNQQDVMCCPRGSNCKVITPTDCTINAYNATAHPENPIHLKDLGVQLAKCGSNCCPPGYKCNGQNLCVMTNPSATGSAAASTVASTTAPTLSIATGAASNSASATSTSLAGSEACASVAAECNPFPATAVLVGLFPGIIIGSLLTFLFVVCVGRRHRVRDDSLSLGPTVAKVSDPIYNGNATRTDFLRHGSRSRTSRSTLRASLGAISSARVRSLFSRTPTLVSKRWDDKAQNGMQTPPAQIRREPSTESIRIYSPPEARVMDRQTTFGDVMKAAGGYDHDTMPPPFLGSPGLVDPRSRGVDAGRLK